MNFLSASDLAELARPWKLLTFLIGAGLLILGPFFFPAPDWDIPISLIMAFFAYLFSGWSMHALVERRWKDFPMMLFLTWWTIDGCYALYWHFKDPAVLEFLRSGRSG